MFLITFTRFLTTVNAKQYRSKSHPNLLQLICHYYRKRGSASYIVREVLSVREREIQRERERERETEVLSPLSC